jgi:hypothetical protein
MGMVKRKATKAARKVPENIPELKRDFLDRIKNCCTEHAIPPSLVLNWDQTGSKMVPVSQWTMAEEGSRQVEVVGIEDKREISLINDCR